MNFNLHVCIHVSLLSLFKKRQGIPHDVVGEGMTRERATDLNNPHSLFLLTQRLGIKDDTHFPEFCVGKQMSAQRVHL